MKKKLIIVMMLILAVAIALPACGGGGGTATPEEPAAPAEQPASTDATDEGGLSNLEASLKLYDNIEGVTGTDGQPLLIYGEARPVPPRPDDPEALPETDPLRFWDIEFAGRVSEKEPMIPSPADGSIGKSIWVIGQSEHPYWSAVFNGMQIAADTMGIELTIKNPNGDLNQQNQLVDQAIAAAPDLILHVTLDSQASEQQFKKIYEAGIPAIAFNMIPSDAAMRYALAVTAPDDFGQFQKLGRHVADSVNGVGGVCYMTHLPGGSPYFARFSNVRAMFAAEYPDMVYLDHQSPGFEAPKAKQVVADWITRFGDELTVIVLSDDSAQGEGTAQAIKEAGRDDIKVVAAGNSKVGMDLVGSGEIYAITYQSAEADGAIAVMAAADYFNGLPLEPVYYLPQAIITKDNVADFLPAQW